MQAVNSFVLLRMPDFEKTEAKVIVLDSSGIYGPMAEVVSVGGGARAKLKGQGISIGDWVVFNETIIQGKEIKGVFYAFIHADGIMGKLDQEEIDAPVMPAPKIQVVPGVN